MGVNAKYLPDNRIAHPGHNAQDFLVPLFPLKRNIDMFKKASEFGYSYEEQDLAQGVTDPGPGPGVKTGAGEAMTINLTLLSLYEI